MTLSRLSSAYDRDQLGSLHLHVYQVGYMWDYVYIFTVDTTEDTRKTAD